MASAREILGRIKSVQNIGQVTRAMEAVSASKMRKAQERTEASREYADKAREVLAHLASQSGASHAHELLQGREPVKRVGIVLITPDRGFVGGLVSNILRKTMRFMEQNTGVEYKLITVGKKGRTFMRRYGPEIIGDFDNPGDDVTEGDARGISQAVTSAFFNGELDAVYLAYAKFVNLMQQDAVVRQLLPLGLEDLSEGAGPMSHGSAPYEIEPGPEEVLDSLLPTLVDMQVYQAITESLASEHSARMVAMRAATDNAKELAEDLRLTYNKARQAAITNEILDIAGGAEALAQADG
ncbi:MAG: ATP synthase F1 subunit gamma [Anaerolineales bacterium]|nr:ATP synthase F1 subunit gamma [Anaerolineales bacterium]MCB9128793.1 ATP synthase F1 subunit gamma [Ardenticatenales bacterium]MCB9171357.1 ATP synthase F1 subunit gamma [Ardenticatenales bacterium]